MGLIRKTLAVGKFAIGVPPGVGPKFYSNGEAIRRQANQQTRILRQMANETSAPQYVVQQENFDARPQRACPACAEYILAEAVLCRFCHSSLEPIAFAKTQLQTASPVQQRPIEIQKTSCKNCNHEIAVTAKICKNCRADI
jgi:hypothetical protein